MGTDKEVVRVDVTDVHKETFIEEQEPEYFQEGKNLAEFFKETFPMTDKEGDKLLGYMEGHDFLLGQKEGELYRGDLCYEQGRVHWEQYSIEDAIKAVFEWNDDLIQETEAAVSNPKNLIDFANKKSYLDTLREDEKILDGMFDRTKYGKELEELAVRLTEVFIQDMDRKEGIDGAVHKMIEQIKVGKNTISDVSPALKQNKGKVR